MRYQDPDGVPEVAPGGGAVDLNLLRTFLAVHRSGSFTAAAQSLGLSQPTVTAQVRALERRLGRALFERRPRGAVPLPYANDLAERVVGPLDALAAVAGGEDLRGAAPARPVYLAGPAELLCERVLPALAPLAGDGVELRVAPGLTGPLLEELRSGRHDLVIATSRPRRRTLPAEPLMDEEFVLVAAPVWAARIGGPGRIAADGPGVLCGLPLVTYEEDLPIVRRYWRHVFGERPACRAAVTVPDLRGVRSAVAAGAGFAVLPRYLCLAELAAGALVALHDPADPPINTVYLARRPGSEGDPGVARVRDALLRAARKW